MKIYIYIYNSIIIVFLLGTLPDYNNDEYEFGCNEENLCELTMSNGQKFIGLRGMHQK